MFSLIPAQNATGNWVKVVQRIPGASSRSRPTPTRPLRSGHERHGDRLRYGPLDLLDKLMGH